MVTCYGELHVLGFYSEVQHAVREFNKRGRIANAAKADSIATPGDAGYLFSEHVLHQWRFPSPDRQENKCFFGV